MKKLLSLYEKFKEPILYIFFGGLTTLVNIGCYALLADLLHIHYLASNAIALVISILFAYVTNRIWVFESKKTGFQAVLVEFGLFIGCRLISALMDMLLMYLFVGLARMDDMLAKCIVQVAVIIANYVFSKIIIFRKK